MIKIRFASEADEVSGFYALATGSRLRALPNGLYELTKPALALLNANAIRYAVLPPAGAADESEAIRNPLTVEL